MVSPFAGEEPRGKALARVTPSGGWANTRHSGAGPQTLESPGQGTTPSRVRAPGETGHPGRRRGCLLSRQRRSSVACFLAVTQMRPVPWTARHRQHCPHEVSGAGAGASDTRPVT